jgi:hypothetical protein
MFFESLEMGSNNPVTWRDSTRVGDDAFSCTKRKRKKKEKWVTWLDPKMVFFFFNRACIAPRDGSSQRLHL